MSPTTVQKVSPDKANELMKQTEGITIVALLPREPATRLVVVLSKEIRKQFEDYLNTLPASERTAARQNWMQENTAKLRDDYYGSEKKLTSFTPVPIPSAQKTIASVPKPAARDTTKKEEKAPPLPSLNLATPKPTKTEVAFSESEKEERYVIDYRLQSKAKGIGATEVNFSLNISYPGLSKPAPLTFFLVAEQLQAGHLEETRKSLHSAVYMAVVQAAKDQGIIVDDVFRRSITQLFGTVNAKLQGEVERIKDKGAALKAYIEK